MMDKAMDGERVCRVMTELAIEAGAATLKHFRSRQTMTWTKSDASPVTEADLEADRIIREGLAKAFPCVAIVSEENSDSHALDPCLDGFFIVDPLDGTRSFVSGNPDFTVNIAYVAGGTPVFGVVHVPADGRVYFNRPDGSSAQATLTGGSADQVESDAVTLSVSRPDNDALVVIASRSHVNASTDAYISRYRVARRESAGSSLKFCVVAAGAADFYPRFGRTMEWDTAAGHAVLLGAGGDVARADDGSRLTYGKPGFVNPDFVAFAAGFEFK